MRLSHVLAALLSVFLSAVAPAPLAAEGAPLEEPLPEGARVRLGTTRLRHGGPVQAVTFSLDSKRIASAGADRVVRIWEAGTGRALAVCETTPTVSTALRFSPDGQFVAGSYYDVGTRIWDASSGKLRSIAAHAGGSSCLAWAPDGKTLASAGQNGSVTLWQTSNGKLLHTLGPHPGPVLALGISPDGKQVLSLTGDGVIRRWDSVTGNPVRQITLAGNFNWRTTRPQTLSFSPDGKYLALGFSNRGLLLWSAEETGQPRQLSVQYQSSIHSIAFSSDSRFIAVANGIGFVSVWGVASGKELRSFPGSFRLTTSVAFSPDGRFLATGPDSAVRLWDLVVGKPLHDEDLPSSSVQSLAFLNGGKTLVTFHEEGAVHAWDAAGRHLSRLQEPGLSAYGLGVLDDAKRIRVVGRPFNWIDWEPGGRMVSHRFSPSAGWKLTPYSPDGKTYVFTEKGPSQLLETVSMKELYRLPDLSPQARSLVWSADGQRFAGHGNDNALRIWDAQTGQPFPSPGVSPFGPQLVGQSIFSPGGRLLAQVSNEVRVWEACSGRERLRFPFVPRSVSCGLFTPDGRALVLGLTTGELLAFDLDTRKEIVNRPGHKGPVRTLGYSADGLLLASGGDDGSALLWAGAAFLPPRRPVEKLSKEEVLRRWDELAGDDGGKAFRALRELGDAPDEAVPLIREKVKPVEVNVAARIDKLIAALDSRRFAEREKAMKELGELGAEAEFAMQRELDRKPTLETKRRIEELLRHAKGVPAGPRLRLFRAVEVLERAGTPAAREVLKELAGGAPHALLTREAKSSLSRLRP
jgi:WD40 repeat protein